MATLIQKIQERGFTRTESGCLEYNGHRNWLGYGQIRHEGALIRVHRAMFEHYSGTTLSAGQVVRHSCDNPPCAAEGHLASGSQAENIGEMRARGRGYKDDWTHCPNGHPYSVDRPPASTKNRCRECARDRNRRYEERRRGAHVLGAGSMPHAVA